MVILLTQLTNSVTAVICEFCNNNFISLGKHTWRCKAKVTRIDENTQIIQPLSTNATVPTQNDNNGVITQANQDIDPHENEKKDHKFCCYCGHEFKSLRVLNTHTQICFVWKTRSIAELLEEAVEEINDVPTDDNENNLID